VVLDLGDGAQSPLYQTASSPLRNPLSLPERSSLGAGWTRHGELVGKTLACLAGVACLEGSDITEDQLATVHSLKGAKMPDGSIHK
jgi:hypothetical protein